MFKKWGVLASHRQAEHPGEERFGVKECRLRALRAATGMNEAQTAELQRELAARVASNLAAEGAEKNPPYCAGETRFLVSPSAAPAELALLWELATMIGLYCRLEGGHCVLRTTPFPACSAEDAEEVLDGAALRLSGLEPSAGNAAGRKRRRKTKKRSFLRAVSEQVVQISLDLAHERLEARQALAKAAHAPAWHGEQPAARRRSSAAVLADGPRGIDNRPAWMALVPPSAPARPLAAGNRGFQLLLKLGWAVGSGLGKSSQGTTEPIAPSTQMNRQGLGSSKCF